jgi:hypothetical protein
MAVSLMPSTEPVQYNPDGTVKNKSNQLMGAATFDTTPQYMQAQDPNGYGDKSALLAAPTSTAVARAPANPDQMQQAGAAMPKPPITGGLPSQSPTSSGAIVPLTPAAQSGGAAPADVAPVAPTTAGTEQANTAVLAKAQTDVLNAPGQSNLQSAYTQKAQDFVNNPMGDYNGQKVKQAEMDSANNDWGKSFEAMRQQFGNVSGSGLLQENMLGNVLQHNTDMAKRSSDLDQVNFERYLDSTGRSLAAAQSAEQQNRNIFSQGLGDAATVRGMAEGERAQETGFKQNVELTKLGFDNAVQMAAVENGYDLGKLNAQFGYDMAKMVANNDFVGAQNKIKQDFDLAFQSNDINATAKNIQAQIDLDKWKQQNGQEFTATQNGLNRALETSLKTMDLEGQKELFNLKTKADEGLLLKQQDFAGAQAAAQRALDEKMQGTDINAAINAMNQKAAIDKQAQDAQNEYNTLERVATQGYNTTERLSQNDFSKLMKTVETEMALALQNNDSDNVARLQMMKEKAELNILAKGFDNTKEIKAIDAKIAEAAANNDYTLTSKLQAERGQIEAQSQSSAQSHEQVMANLQDRLANATAEKDVIRQAGLLRLQADLTFQENEKKFGYDTALKAQQAEIDKAMQSGDYVNARNLQDARINAEALNNDANRSMQLMEIKLRERGLNMDEFANIKSLVEQGYLEPEAAQAQLDKLMTDAGMSAADLPRLQNPNSPDTIKKTLDAQYESTKYQWATTMRDQNPAFIDEASPDGLSDAGRKEFAKFYTESLYGKPETLSEIIGDTANLQGAANEQGTPERKAYDTALSKATPISSYSESPKTGSFMGTYKFNSVPAIGSYIKTDDGKLYVVTSGVSEKKRIGSTNSEYFAIKDVNTGATTYYMGSALGGQVVGELGAQL